MPLNYSPLRYTLFLIPAVIVLAFALMDKLLLRRKIAAVIPDWWATAFLGLLFWFALYHLVGNVFYFNNTPYRALTWGCLPGAAVLALVVRYVPGKFRLRLGRPTVVLGVLVMVGLSVLANGFRIRRTHYLEHNFNLKEANEDIREILGPDAVVSGPYGPALTIDTDLKVFIHLFGVADIDSTLFDRHPITHIAVDASNLSEAVKGYPQLDGLAPVTSWWIRDTEVKLFRISELFENPQAARYQLSHYEKAVAYVNESQLDSAQIEINLYLTEHRMTKSSGRLMADISLRTGQYDNALRLVSTMAEKYPTDFSVQMMCGKVYMLLASKSENQALMPQAYKYFDRGVKVNRFKAGYATQLVQETMQRIQQRKPVGGQTP
jgi:tetratricopeptide (TPR) repeat protein